MSEASPDFRSRRLPVAPRRAAASSRVRRGVAVGASRGEEPFYPLDPPLEDVRIPVEAPHATATAYSRIALRHRFPGAQVGDDLPMLFGEPSMPHQSRLAPDVFVTLRLPRRATRGDYDADELGPPDFVLEVLSRSTWKHDLGRKLDCYQQIGVRECLLFDATGESMPVGGEGLWGFSLTPERREPLEEVALPNGERGVCSAVLGLVAYVAERVPPVEPRETWVLTMRWHDPATGVDLPDYEESRAGEADARVREEQARRKRSWRELMRTRPSAKRRRKEPAQKRASAGSRNWRKASPAARRVLKTQGLGTAAPAPKPAGTLP